MTQAPVTYCANHPGVETSLRCNKCEKYICPKCAVKTPTGYRCRECVRGQQKQFETAEWYDYGFGFLTAAILSVVASSLVGLVGSLLQFWGLIILAAIAPTAGVIISEVIRKVTGRRRSKKLFITIAVAVALGVLPQFLINLFMGNVFGILYQIAYLVLVVPTVYYRLSGIQLFK